LHSVLTVKETSNAFGVLKRSNMFELGWRRKVDRERVPVLR